MKSDDISNIDVKLKALTHKDLARAFDGTVLSNDEATRQSQLRSPAENAYTVVKMELANRVFFRLYQCANMLHKTGSRAVEAEGLTTQRWAIMGALSRSSDGEGMSIGDLARYLMVSRQNLSAVMRRLVDDGQVCIVQDNLDGRAKIATLTTSGREVWEMKAIPKINAYYENALDGFSVNDMSHTLHYLLKMLSNMRQLDVNDIPEEQTGSP